MKKIQINVRATAADVKLFKAAAKDADMSLNKFVTGSAKLLAVLALYKEQSELVSSRLAGVLLPLLDKVSDQVNSHRSIKKAS